MVMLINDLRHDAFLFMIGCISLFYCFTTIQTLLATIRLVLHLGLHLVFTEPTNVYIQTVTFAHSNILVSPLPVLFYFTTLPTLLATIPRFISDSMLCLLNPQT